MTTVLTTILSMFLFVAALDVAWSIRMTPTPKPVEQLVAVPTPEPPVQFDEAYQRYVDQIVHSKYKDRLPLETERLEQHLSILRQQLEAQRRLIEEARRP